MRGNHVLLLTHKRTELVLQGGTHVHATDPLLSSQFTVLSVCP